MARVEVTMNDKLSSTSTREINPVISKPPLVKPPLEEWDEHLSRDSEDSWLNAAVVCERDLQLKTTFSPVQSENSIRVNAGKQKDSRESGDLFLNINLGKMSQRNVGFVPIRIANVSLEYRIKTRVHVGAFPISCDDVDRDNSHICMLFRVWRKLKKKLYVNLIICEIN
jgi:hypothetical protein